MVSVSTEMRREMAGHEPVRGSAGDKTNVGETERWLSLAGGLLLGLEGLREGNLRGLALTAAGGFDSRCLWRLAR